MSVIYAPKSSGFNPLGILGTVASLAIPGAGPWIAGANALGSALSGDWAGAAKNAAGALIGKGMAAAGAQKAPTLMTQAESNPNYAGQQLSELNDGYMNIGGTGSGAGGSTSAWAPKDNQVINRNMGGIGSGPDGSTSAWAPKDSQILNTVMAAAGKSPEFSASDQKYNGLLDMYGLGAGGNGAFNADAAKKYYQTYPIGGGSLDTADSASVFEALMRMYGRS